MRLRSLDDLPKELIEHMMCFIRNPKCLFVCLTVSQKFHDAVTNYKYRDLLFGEWRKCAGCQAVFKKKNEKKHWDKCKNKKSLYPKIVEAVKALSIKEYERTLEAEEKRKQEEEQRLLEWQKTIQKNYDDFYNNDFNDCYESMSYDSNDDSNEYNSSDFDSSEYDSSDFESSNFE